MPHAARRGELQGAREESIVVVTSHLLSVHRDALKAGTVHPTLYFLLHSTRTNGAPVIGAPVILSTVLVLPTLRYRTVLYAAGTRTTRARLSGTFLLRDVATGKQDEIV